MAVIEQNALLTGKDAAGNKTLLYPITKLECVDGAEELMSEDSFSQKLSEEITSLTTAEIDAICV